MAALGDGVDDINDAARKAIEDNVRSQVQGAIETERNTARMWMAIAAILAAVIAVKGRR